LAVVVDLNKTGALIARCLGRAGVRVTGAHTVRQPALGASSRYVEEAVVRHGIPPGQLLEILSRLVAPTAGKAVLMCATDEAVDFCSRYRSALEARFHLPTARAAPLHELLDKGRQAALAARSGLAVPPTVSLKRNDPQSLATLARIPLPAMVKPGNSLFGYKRFMGVEQTRAGLEARVAATLSRCPHLLVSSYVPGGPEANYTVMGLGRRGRPPLMVSVIRKLRQVPEPAFGAASLAETCADDELASATASFISEAGLTGPFELEFKREEGSGRPWFIEANFRFSALVEMTEAGGISLPHLVYLDALGCDLPDEPPTRRTIRWVDEFRDWRLCATGHLPLDELFRGYSDVNHLSLFDRDDPAPFDIALRRARDEAGTALPLFELALARLLRTFDDAGQAGARPVAVGAEGRDREVVR
jgi:predicted ATP-grasp superfamily ATP-dependent carboligase